MKIFRPEILNAVVLMFTHRQIRLMKHMVRDNNPQVGIFNIPSDNILIIVIITIKKTHQLFFFLVHFICLHLLLPPALSHLVLEL